MAFLRQSPEFPIRFAGGVYLGEGPKETVLLTGVIPHLIKEGCAMGGQFLQPNRVILGNFFRFLYAG